MSALKIFPLESVTLDTPDDELRCSYCALCDRRLLSVKESGCPEKRCQWKRRFRALSKSSALSEHGR